MLIKRKNTAYSMIFEFIIFIVLGVAIGILTGILPGMHINLVAISIAALLPLINVNPLFAAVSILAIAVTHIFVDFIPATFLGVANADDAIMLLPAQRMLLDGKAYEAIFLAVAGCLFGILIIVPLSPIIFAGAGAVYRNIKNLIPYILIISLIILVVKEKNKIWALIIVFISGLFGIAAFNLNVNEVLFPMFSGLFGISSLIISISNYAIIPKQFITKVKLKTIRIFKILSNSVFASLLVGFLPGMGSAQASVLATSFSRRYGKRSYIVLVSAINSIVMIIAIIALFTINKARNGAVAIMANVFYSSLTEYLVLFIGEVLFAAGIAAIISILLARVFVKFIEKINYKIVSYGLILFIFLLVLFISKLSGVFILLIGAAIGIMPIVKKVSRNHLMACLIIPIIFY